MGTFQGYPVVVQFSSFHSCFNGRHQLRVLLKNIKTIHTLTNLKSFTHFGFAKLNKKKNEIKKFQWLQSKIRFGESMFDKK